MKECNCYHTEEEIMGWHTPVDPKTKMTSRCWGTREREECSCGGDPTKCNFYPEIREKALKELEPKLGEWISVKDRLPEYNTKCLVYIPEPFYYPKIIVAYYSSTKNIWIGTEGSIYYNHRPTHWMPLPSPPTDKEN